MPDRRLFRAALPVCAMMASTTCATFVGAANESPSATSSNSGGGSWGFFVALAIALIAFIACGAIIALRARREYLTIEARKAHRQPDEAEEEHP